MTGTTSIYLIFFPEGSTTNQTWLGNLSARIIYEMGFRESTLIWGQSFCPIGICKVLSLETWASFSVKQKENATPESIHWECLTSSPCLEVVSTSKLRFKSRLWGWNFKTRGGTSSFSGQTWRFRSFTTRIPINPHQKPSTWRVVVCCGRFLQVAISYVVGGLEHLSFLRLLGIIIPTDYYVSGRLKPPTSSTSYGILLS